MYEKSKTLSDNNNNIETGMIWGNQFDRTLMWLMECNAKDETTGKSKEEVISDSTSWGNYSNANNIYDLAGNVFDWTMEACDTNYRVPRGGYYSSNGTLGPASHRITYSSPAGSFSNYGTRATFYIK